MTTFSELGLSERALEAVHRLGYAEPTPVQARAIPCALAGSDIIAAAKTGTGKTAAFALPSMDRLGRAAKKTGPLMLVITPTRELAQQIGEVCGQIAVSTHHRILTVVGGLSYNPQIERLKSGVDVLIATPGRLIDLMDRGAVDLSFVEVLVLDEADRMLDMGFLPSVKRIVRTLPDTRQTLLFSATIDDAVERSVGDLLHDPERVEVAHCGEVADIVEQHVVRIAHAAKPAALEALLSSWGADRVIVFARTRGRADSCVRRLTRRGFSVAAIHSSKSQNQRKRALDAFAAGEIGVIAATDVLARGIDVSGVDYVVNYDAPDQPEDYVHRIGRTGRAGVPGRAVTFVSPETEGELRAIEKLTHQKLPEMTIDGFDADQAELDAVARSQRAAARHDPEIAQAKRELAARAKRKAKAKGTLSFEGGQDARTDEGDEAPKPRRTAKGAPKNATGDKAAKRKPAGKAAAAKAKAPGATGTTDPKAKRDAKPSKATRGASGAKAPKGGAKAKPSSKPKGTAKAKHAAHPRAAESGAAAKRDVRPGRAHRAAVAEQRRRKRM